MTFFSLFGVCADGGPTVHELVRDVAARRTPPVKPVTEFQNARSKFKRPLADDRRRRVVHAIKYIK